MSDRRPIEDIYPLSPMQQGMLFHTLYEPHSGTHVLQLCCRLAGALDRTALRRALDRVVERHAVLRTSFVWEEVAEPLQVVERSVPLPLAEEDWRGLDAAEREARLASYLASDLTSGFDLAQPPLLRLLLAREAEDGHRLVWSSPLLLFDGWSMPRLIGEVLACYQAFSRGEQPALAATRPYRDFIAWLHARRARGGEAALAQAEAYWRRELGGFTAPTPLPGDRGTAAIGTATAEGTAGAAGAAGAASGNGAGGGPVMASRQLLLPAAATAALAAFGRRQGVTVNTLVQGAWALLLAHGGGAGEVVFGATVAGRPPELPGVESMIGVFINTLPVRVAAAPRQPLAAWLRELQQRQAAARQFEHLPLARIQGWSELPPATPLFGSLVVFENYPVAMPHGNGAGGGLGLEDLRFVEANHYPLTLEVVPGDRLQLKLTYDRRRFAAAIVVDLLARVAATLAAMPAMPAAATVGELPRFGPEVRHRLLHELNAGPPRPAGAAPPPLHALFEAAAAARPAAVAVACADQQVTYGELARRTSLLAGRLQRLGVGVESRVGLCLPRSLDAVEAIVAVLRAGGAYVPLDPELPDARLAFLLADAGVRVVLTLQALAPRLTALAALAPAVAGAPVSPQEPPAASPAPAASWQVVALDAMPALELVAPAVAEAGSPGPGSPAGTAPAPWQAAAPPPEAAAYVIYTSGSTGRPKGVVVSHGAAARLVAATQPWFGFGPGDVWTLFHSYAFDFSVWEMWGALATGGRLVVVPYLVSRSPEELHRLLAGEDVTVLNQTPTAFRQLQALPAGAPAALRLVIFGGEALAPASLAPWLARHGDARPRLVNMYGITETTVHVTYRPLGRADAAPGAAASPIGVPIPDLQLHLADAGLELVPPLAPGELCVGGAGLARGYLDRPGLTAERFVPDPWSGVPGARLYRSGDLGRRLPGGEVEYLGRADSQLKIRGFRIEPGEIQAVLAAHPAVRDAVVVAQGNGEERRLVAYVAADAAAAPAAELRRLAGERLPDHMVPVAFVHLDRLPLTANGKLDVAALAPPTAEARAGAAWEPPAGAAETALAAIWEEVLGVPRVGAHDSFFALGGDSIHTLRVVSRARDQGLALTLPEVFRHPTLRDLARVARAVRHAGDQSGAAGGGQDGDGGEPARAAAASRPFDLLSAADRALLPADLEDAYPLTQLQAGMLFHSQYSPDTAIYHDLFSSQVQCLWDGAALVGACRELVRRHPALRTSFDLSGASEPLQRVHRTAPLELAVVDLTGVAPGRQPEALTAGAAAERARAFDWRRAPLLRFHVYRRGADSLQLVFSFHHAILDGWSVASLLTELFQLYRSLGDGAVAVPAEGATEAPPAPPDTGLRRFVELERAALAAPPAQEYWRRELALHAASELPRWGAAGGAALGASGERGDRQESRGGGGRGSLWADLPVVLGEQLDALARRLGLPFKSVLLAAHARVLATLCGQSVVTTGIVVGGRAEELGGERALGLFLNTLPLRLDVAAASWEELARRAFAAESALLPFRHYPLAALQQQHGAPLFEAAFNYVHFRVYQELAHLPEMQSATGDLEEETNFPFSAGFIRSPRGTAMALRLDHDADRIPHALATAALELYRRALARLAACPQAPSDESLLAPAERHQVLVECNDSGDPWDAGEARATVPQLWAAQAARSPAAVAVVAAGAGLTVTYGEIERRANLLARHLRALGVGREVRVGLLAGRSPALVVGLLAIWKAGGAAVALDPLQPPARRGRQLAGAVRGQWPAVLVSDDGEATPGDAGTGAAAPDGGTASGEPGPEAAMDLVQVRLTALGDLAAGAATATTPRGGAADQEDLPQPAGGDLACVIHTSGSTGQPKAAMIEHGQLAHTLRGFRKVLGAGTARRVPVVASCGFDAFFFELLAPLLEGGTAVLLDQGAHLDLERLADELLRASTFFAVPAQLRRIVDTLRARQPRPAGPEKPERACWVISGGEAVPAQLVTDLRAVLPWARFGVIYGPTECTIAATWHESGEVPASSQLGRPLPGFQVDLVGEDGREVPAGTPGEIWVGGGGVGRGYLGQASQTAAAFVPWRGGRAYRTGDLARRRLDGALEFLGRIDRQVKVRGVRIEPAEIESALVAHPRVAQAAVVPRPGPDGAPRLVAYLVPAPAGEAAPGTLELLAFLRPVLPEPMLPAVFVQLPALPLTATGKVDRGALPAPPSGRPELEAPFVAPRVGLEALVAAQWAEILGVPRVGIHDNFFALGGHSLLATQVVSRLRDRLGIELALRVLFEAPTVAGLAAYIDARSPADRAAVEAGAPRAAPPPSAPAGEAAPLSFAQQRLWFLDRLSPGSTAYNIAIAVRLSGLLDGAALGAAVGEIVRRHEALRTTFGEQAGTPVQRIGPAVRADGRRALPLVDLAALGGGRRGEEEAARLAVEMGARPFDLERGPLFRPLLVRVDAATHLLAAVMHHIIGDGWSMGVLVRELSALYGAVRGGAAPPSAVLPPLALQYADFASWQRRHLAGAALDGELAHWRERLRGLPAALDLPTDRPRPPVRRELGLLRTLRLPHATVAGLRALALAAGATRFMVVVAGLEVLLGRFAGSDDFAIGTPVAGRNRLEIEGLIGFFVNTLVLRSDLAAGGDWATDFTSLLGRVRETVIAAQAHQDLPFERLVEELAPERSLARTPLFQVMLAYQNAPSPLLALPGLTVTGAPAGEAAARFDLELDVDERGDHCGLRLTCDRDLFDAATAERLLGQLGRLLAAAAAAPGTPWRELSLLSAAESHQAAREWNDTAVPASPRPGGGGAGGCGDGAAVGGPLAAAFAAQAGRTPDAVAMADDAASQLSYGRLDALAHGLARRLAELGAWRETLVGVALPRGLDLPVALLGILRAGAAFVPLDPAQPPARLRAQAAAAALSLVVTVEEHRQLFAQAPGIAHVVCLDRGRAAGEGGEDGAAGMTAALPAVGGEALAYVLFTSGSTGEPKGVMVPHGALANQLRWVWRRFPLAPGDRVLLRTPLSFDPALVELFLPLLAGARVEAARADAHGDAHYLAGAVARRGVTLVQMVPAVARLLAAEDGLAGWGGVHSFLCGGEALPASVAGALVRRLPGARLHNLYGPTEATVYATGWAAPLGLAVAAAGAGAGEASLPIGRPIDNLRAQVLGPALEPVPLGGVGELCLAGAGLARGYLRQPARTAASFAPDPAGIDAGGRLYRTGDLVRQRADGTIEFLGRADQQVKIRGVRVEPGEVQAVLATHPALREAAVVARRDGGGAARLIAYVVAGGPALEAPELRSWLRARLPEVLVPAAFVQLAALPRTAGGKLDRRALPAPPDAGAPDGGDRAGFAPPRTVAEQLLAGIWEAVLAARQVGREDDFFERGGHSLLATQVTSRVARTFGVDLPLGALFEAPRLRDLALRIEALRAATAAAAAGDGDAAPRPPLVPRPRQAAGGPLPLSFAQQRLWFLDRLEPDSAIYNMPYALAARGELDLRRLDAALGEVVRRHEALRTRFPERDGLPEQVVDPPAAWRSPRVDLDGLPAARRRAEASRLASLEAARPFDLVRGPVLRATLLRLAADDHVLLLDLHHIVSDGWSMGVLSGEITALYNRLAGASPPAAAAVLPALPVQYADFALWQRQWLDGPTLARQLAFWRRLLAEAPVAVELPLDRPRPAAQSYRGGRAGFALAPPQVEALRQLGRVHGATLFMVLLGGFAALLARLSGQDDLVIGAPIANRTQLETEGLIGFFVNSLALRHDLGGDPDVAELVARERRLALAAFAHQDLPFEKLVEELRPERHLSHNPLFQVMFALQNAPASAVELPGLTLSPVEFVIPDTKFDLVLTCVEVGAALDGMVDYATDLFDAATARRMTAQLATLLAGAAAEPARRLSQLPLLDAGERHQLLVEWNDTAAAVPSTDVGSLFLEQARRRPQAVAVSSGAGDTTYGELAAAAVALARRLAAAGVGPEVRVGLLAERSPEMVAGTIAIVLAGGAYVPLDPAYPAERLALMLGDAQARVLLGQERLLAALPPELAAGVACVQLAMPAAASPAEIGAAAEAIAATAAWRAASSRALAPDGLAYVMYTSGSTGVPKGVGIPHRGIVRLVRQGGYTDLGPDRVLLQLATVSFDAATLELWGALANGGRVALPPPGRLSLRDIGACVERWGVTTLFMTTGLFHQVVEEDLAVLGSVSHLMTGGDVLSPSHMRRALAGLPRLALSAVYGPTEATTFTSHHRMREVPEASVPLGRPIGNTRVHVVGPNLEVTAPGVWGEIWVGGGGLARGYLGQPELTADSFRPDPFATPASAGGARLYRTGDVGRRRADGRIEFGGRRDGQVKLRGFRIELGEIESALTRQPDVAAAAVAMVARSGGRWVAPGPGTAGADQRLVAYVVARTPAAAAAGDATGTGDGSEASAATLAAGFVDQWQDLYEQLYGEGLPAAAQGDATFNVQGWNSTYTGQPIPAPEMREWLAATVARIAALGRRRILEIGCGTGLLLYRLAPGAERYRGSDFSAVALAGIRRQLARPAAALPQVELALARADDWRGVAPGDFDLVILNSVVQYFPSIGYLADVLRAAVATVSAASAGNLFLGDLRHLPLLPAMALSVEMARAGEEHDDLPLAELRRRLRRRLAEEDELVVDPAFFAALRGELPAIRRGAVLLKRGAAANELTRFRYDVVIDLGAAAAGGDGVAEVLDWQADGLAAVGLEGLAQRLAAAGDQLEVRAIPNRRVSADVAALALLDGAEGLATLGDLRRAVAARLAASPAAIDPEAAAQVGERLGFDVQLLWDGGAGDTFTASFARGAARLAGAAGTAGVGDAPPEVPPVAPPRGAPDGPDAPGAPVYAAYATDPLRRRLELRLAPRLRQALRAELPEYMVPAAFVLLDQMPLTLHGKIDRAALLAATDDWRPATGAGEAPRDAVEEALAQIFRELLGVEAVGVQDSFFDLGGHSLLATQAVSRLRDRFAVELPVRTLFEEPTVGGLAAWLRPRLGGVAAATAPPIVPRPAGTEAPLSFAQRRLWFLDRLTPGSSAYNMGVALRLRGPLDLAALAAAVHAVTCRHQALRTTFGDREGDPVQRVAPAGPPAAALPRIDLLALPAAAVGGGTAAEGEALRLAAAILARPFDLERGPLFRPLLIRQAPDVHLLVAAIHHIVGDGWSLGVLVRELSALYAAPGTPLPELPVQYPDFALWQTQWLTGAVLAEQIAYWRGQLRGLPPRLDVPADRPRPAVETWRGGHLPVRLGPATAAGVHRLARELGATPFMVLLAAFQALLGRQARQQDLAVGTPIAGRNRSQIEGLIGFFVNALVLRGDLAGDPDGRELVRRAKAVALGAYAHQDLPFEKLVEELAPARSLAHSPLFQVMFALQNAPAQPLLLPGVAVEMVEGAAQVSKFDLSVHLFEGDGDVAGWLEYRLDLFDAPTMLRLREQFRVLVGALVDVPSIPLGELPWLGAGERHQVVHEWGSGGSRAGVAGGVGDAGDPGDHRAQTLAAAVAAQVARTPLATAVAWRGGQVTYRDLGERAARLAHRLVALGVGPEVPVAVHAARTPDLVAALIAVLWAGGAYVALDPRYPAERLALVLADCGAPLLLSDEDGQGDGGDGTDGGAIGGVARRLAAAAGVALVPIGEPGGAAGARGDGALPALGALRGENLAYVIYTSGSTGRPKGVAIPHAGAVALLAWAEELFPAADLAGVLAATSVAFDLSVFELFAPLTRGGTVVLVPDVLALLDSGSAGGADGAGGPAWPITLVNTVPSALAELLQSRELPRSVRTVNLAGEPLPAALAAAVWERSHAERLFNLYGPSEDTTYSTWWCGRRGATAAGAPPIGRPIAGSRAQVLDAGMRPVPPGVPGELYLGGDGLARGYLRRPDLTAASFVPDPGAGTTAAPGDRLYRTGDLVRLLADGNLAFLGRLDQQVKVRGFRIELGDVEAALAAAPGVAAAAVEARGRGADRRLLAWVAPAPGATVTAEQVRHLLRARLPEAMIPGTVSLLDDLPRLPNGKLDRRALAALPAGEPGEASSAGAAYQAPRTATEAALAAIWCDLLAMQRVGVRDDFFALGGHSLLAVRLMARVRRQFGSDLPLASLFASGTVERLAALLAHGGAVAPREALVRLTPPDRTAAAPALFCVHPAGGNVLCYADLARACDADLPVYGLQVPEALVPSAPAAGEPGVLAAATDAAVASAAGVSAAPGGLTVEGLAARYAAAVRAVQPAGPYHLAGWSLGGGIAFEMARQLTAAGQPVALLALIDAPAPGGGGAVIGELDSRDGLAGGAGRGDRHDGDDRNAGDDGDDGGEADDAVDAGLLAWFARDLAGLHGYDLAPPLAELRRLPAAERIPWLVAAARAADLLPPELDAAEIERLFGLFRAVAAAARAHRPAAWEGQTGEALLLLGTASRLPELTANADPTCGWGRLAPAGVTVERVPGDHYSMLREPGVQTLAASLRRRLGGGEEQPARGDT